MGQIGAGSGIDPVDRSPGGAHKPEEIVAKLRQVDVVVSQGRPVAEAVRSIGGSARAATGSRLGRPSSPIIAGARSLAG